MITYTLEQLTSLATRKTSDLGELKITTTTRWVWFNPKPKDKDTPLVTIQRVDRLGNKSIINQYEIN